jgi:hypothetical protein
MGRGRAFRASLLALGILFCQAALRTKGVPFELHLYERGGHGLGLHERRDAPNTRHPWTVECARWLRERGWTR